MSKRILIMAGRGRYEDPWHDHAATSHAVATILTEPGLVDDGVEVEVRSSFPDALAELESVDLLVVNSGKGRPDADFDGDDQAWRAFHQRIRDWASEPGRGILALHQAANTFSDAPEWESLLGGRWINGRSWHPPIGEAVFELVPGHPITDALAAHGITAIEAFDERYLGMRLSPDVHQLGRTEDPDGEKQTMIWAHQGDRAKTVYSGVGHDLRSYESATHRAFLREAARWLLS